MFSSHSPHSRLTILLPYLIVIIPMYLLFINFKNKIKK